MDIRQRVLEWSSKEPLWRQDLLRRVARAEATDTDCAEVLELLLKERGLSDVAPAARPLQLDDLPEETPRSTEVVVEIGRCANVNSIESEDALTFEPSGITLVYGDNAAGKSSYARALKSISRAAHRFLPVPGRTDSRPDVVRRRAAFTDSCNSQAASARLTEVRVGVAVVTRQL